MKLRSPHLLAYDHAAVRRTIIGHSSYALLILRLDIVRVCEVEIHIRRYICKDRQSFTQDANLVPAHVRNFWPMWNAPHLAPEQFQTINLALGMVIGQQLHPQADTQERFALPRRRANSLIQTTLSHGDAAGQTVPGYLPGD